MTTYCRCLGRKYPLFYCTEPQAQQNLRQDRFFLRNRAAFIFGVRTVRFISLRMF